MLENNKDIKDKLASNNCKWLTMAINNCDYETVKLLLEQGANITIKDDLGNTPLHSAVLTGNKSIVSLFFTTSKEAVGDKL